MKKITVILLSLLLLLSTLLQGCDDAQWADESQTESQTEETPKQEEPMTPVEPFRADSGDYVYDAKNMLVNKFDNIVCDCFDLVELDYKAAINYCDELSVPSVEWRSFVNEQYKSITEYDICGTKIPVQYTNSRLYADEKILHYYDKIRLDKNGKLAYLNLEFVSQENEDKEKITEEEAKSRAVKLITEHTCVSDLASWNAEIVLSSGKNYYEVDVYKTISGIRTAQYIRVGVDFYTGSYWYVNFVNAGLFDADISISVDKEIIEQEIVDAIESKLEKKTHFYDEPYYVKEWEEMFKEEYKGPSITVENSSQTEVEDDRYDEEEEFYTATYFISSDYLSFDYKLCVYNGGTPYIVINVDLQYVLVESDCRGTVLFAELYWSDSYSLCIFPDGSAVVQAQNQESLQS